MKRTMLRTGSAMVAAVAALAFGAPAEAENGAKTKVVLKKLSATGASGKLKSQNGSCKRNRTVTLFTYEGFSSRKLESTKSNSSGRWSIERDLKPGDYFAKADSTGGCRYGVSKKKTLG